MVTEEPTISSKKLSSIIHENFNKEIESSTVRRILINNDLKAHKAVKKPFLSKKMKEKRLAFCRMMQDKDDSFWERVIFSDESRISLWKSDKPPMVRRRRSESLEEKYLQPTVKYPLNLMIWGCFRKNKIGPLSIIDGTMDSKKYIQLLETKLIPFIGERKSHFIFQDDSAPCHRSSMVKNFKMDCEIQSLDWPGNSPDLNPIENLWSILKRKVAMKAPHSKRTLIEAIIDVWYNGLNDDDVLSNLILSMRSRITECIKNKGGHTSY